MELKFDNNGKHKGAFIGFNRTFMELKYISNCTGMTTLVVLIVPLWN